ncbi:mechanosensitive ion channel family protein [Candidatus Woesearchaeota archaeon]|nr:mechanosensitive ion channel family protein [Candidatus Woesearchaeota archaeon]
MELLEFLRSPAWTGVRQWVLIGLILLITLMTASLVNRLMRQSFARVEGAAGLATQGKKRFAFLRRIVIALIYLFGASFSILSVPQLRSVSLSLFAGAGVLALILGFAAQKAFGNVISGIFISVSKPFCIGDRIMINQDFGIVEDLTLRHTVIRTPTNDRLVIPNSKMDEASIHNFSLNAEQVLSTFDIGISYDSDVDRARKIIEEEIVKHPKFILGTENSEYLHKDERVKVRIVNLGDFSVVLRAYFWAENKSTAFMMNCDILEMVKKRFGKEKVGIPYPHRTIVYKKDLDAKKRRIGLKRK